MWFALEQVPKPRQEERSGYASGNMESAVITSIQQNFGQQLWYSERSAISAVLHGDLDEDSKQYGYVRWKTGEAPVIFATKAFAARTDHSSVRPVLHTRMASSLSSYVQESALLSRDGAGGLSVMVASKQKWKNGLNGMAVEGWGLDLQWREQRFDRMESESAGLGDEEREKGIEELKQALKHYPNNAHQNNMQLKTLHWEWIRNARLGTLGNFAESAGYSEG
ncbi:hypothetical protein INT43_001563 [Umbelopsis isabellina]|uniref:Uncharacterized protein n=1 Tax=Mortierella isabellina TaxID=91625 RepID=A0A8H7U6V6_MORIS|nr:hypothetical protein INT43_001563 [Umbelopsis isabellina]